jgi:Flp pilus assembly protein TadG
MTTHHLKKFAKNESGNVAMLFGLSTFVVVGMVGGAVDLGRAMTSYAAMQDTADYAALNAAVTNANDIRDSTSFKTTATAAGQAEAIKTAQKRAATLGATNATVTLNWVNATDVKAVATTRYDTTFMKAVPGLPTAYNISAQATARSNVQLETASKPSKVELSYEAADYNQMWVYCFDKDWASKSFGSGKTARTSDEGTSKANMSGNLSFTKDMAVRMNQKGRSDFTLISDNGGSTLAYSMPTCAAGETVSYALYNSRNNRATPANWGSNYTTCSTSLSVSKTCYQWYTDTKRTEAADPANAVESYSTSPYQIETILCDDPNCSSITGGGANPNTTGSQISNRTTNRPPVTAKGCQPGKYMYVGWEDRPPQNSGGNGSGQPLATGVSDPGGDRDYDDIRVIVNCPQFVPGSRQVTLIN